ncbi:MAG: RNA methyltransferase [Bacteroidia bacterium]
MPPLPHPPKFYQALHQAAHRKATGLYLALGHKLLAEALKSLPPQAFHAILYDQEGPPPLVPPSLQGLLYPLPAWQIARIAQQETPQGVIAVLHQPALSMPDPLPPAILAERLQDPGNLGTLLRTMEWLGYKYLWLTEDSVDPFHPKVVRASMGSLFRLQVARWKEWKELLRHYEGRTVVADPQGKPATEVSWARYDSLYLGGEASGAQRAPQHWLRVSIPPSPTAQAESLNVSLAAALLLYTRREIMCGRLHTLSPL